MSHRARASCALRLCRAFDGVGSRGPTLSRFSLRLLRDVPCSPGRALDARACALVYEDEFGHMCKGIVGLDMAEMSDADWARMAALSVELATMRIHMRNGQFSYPLSAERIAAIAAGQIEPVAFDFEKAATY